MASTSALLMTLICTFVPYMSTVNANEHAKKLYLNLFKNYTKLVRPVRHHEDKLTVKLGLKLTQLIGVDEKNQIMTTNVWLKQEWFDFNLEWKPEEFGGVDHLYVPANEIWKPDIVLYNNADGNFEVTLMTKATVRYTGQVVWEPPAIYKSSCTINVEFFPFDEQTCLLKFSSWTYDGLQVDLQHIGQADIDGEVDIEEAIDLKDYYASFIWDIMAVPARRNIVSYTCCPEIYPDVTFNITIRRKTLFYTVNLILPCVSISFLTVLVFYLPSDSGEKITLCISILLSLTVFFLLLNELIPPTSLVVPLIGKYLLFTMILVTISIIVTVFVLNLHNRHVKTHLMSKWVQRVFLDILPKFLMIKRPDVSLCAPVTRTEGTSSKGFRNNRSRGSAQDEEVESLLIEQDPKPNCNDSCNLDGTKQMSDTVRIVQGVEYIAEHLRKDDDEKQIHEDWKYVAMVIDRLFLWLFTTACIVGTFGIILQAPTLYDDTKPLTS